LPTVRAPAPFCYHFTMIVKFSVAVVLSILFLLNFSLFNSQV